MTSLFSSLWSWFARYERLGVAGRAAKVVETLLGELRQRRDEGGNEALSELVQDHMIICRSSVDSAVRIWHRDMEQASAAGKLLNIFQGINDKITGVDYEIALVDLIILRASFEFCEENKQISPKEFLRVYEATREFMLGRPM